MSYLRFRRSIGLGKGVRFNINKSSVGVSFGIPGLRYSFNSSRQRRRSIGIPGTGLYAVSTSGGRSGSRSGGEARPASSSSRHQAVTVTSDMAEQVIPKPGLFASGAERRFRDGVVAYLEQRWSDAAAAFEQATASDTRNISDDFLLGNVYAKQGRTADSARSLERVVASDIGLPDELMRKYVPGTLELQLPITEQVTVAAPFNSVGATLILAELYQELHRLPEAIGLVQRLTKIAPDDATIKLSLADLLYDDNDFDGIIKLTDDVENRDDVTLATLHLRAKALANEGMAAPAVVVLSACLRRTAHRDPDLLKEIRYNRAAAYELLGDKRKAKTDWTKLVADDPSYRDARQRLEAASL